MSQRTRANSRGPADSRGARSRVLSRRALAEKLVLERRRGRKIVFTSGCYDLLHVGHLRSFEQAAGLGDLLVVGVNRDRRVRELKGRGRPLTPERQRAEMVAGLAPVDWVVLFSEADAAPLIRVLRPDVVCKGGEYRGTRIYDLTKTMYENKAYLRKAFGIFGRWNPDKHIGAKHSTTPFHPGAVKYLKEKGLWKGGIEG